MKNENNVRNLNRAVQNLNLGKVPPTHGWEIVDATVAKDLLAKNKGNRTVNKQKVKYYKRIIESGEFKDYSGDPICIDTNDTLINGQHRLKAILETNSQFVMGVMRNCLPEIANVMDQGMPRSVSDLLDIKHGAQDIKYKNMLSSDAKRITKGFGTNSYLAPSNNEISDFAIKYKETFYEFYQAMAKSKYSQVTVRSAFIGFAILYPGRKDDILGWCKSLVDNTFAEKKDPLNLFSKKFDELEAKKRKDKDLRVKTVIFYSYALAMVQAKLDGKPIKRLKPLEYCPLTQTTMSTTDGAAGGKK